MPIGVMQFQPLSFEQNNPLLAGMQAGANLQGTNLANQLGNLQNQAQLTRNAYLGPTLQAGLQNQQLTNQGLSAGLPYIAPQAAANVALAQSQGAQARGLAGYYGAQGNLITQETPFDVQKAQAAVYTDPILSRLNQAHMATGIPLTTLMANSGLMPQNQNGQPQQQNGQAGQAGAPPMQQYPQNGNYTASPLTGPKLFGGNTFQNYAMFGTPAYNPIDYAGMVAQAQKQATGNVDAWNKAQLDANTAAQESNDLQTQLNKFSNAYDKSTYKGSTLGQITPLSPQGILASTIGQHDWSPEQNANAAAAQLTAMATHQMFPGQRVTNNETQLGGLSKPSILMNPDAKNSLIQLLSAKAQRSNEYQQFMDAARQSGITSPQTAQALFQTYNQQRPYFDAASNKPFNTGVEGWRAYLSPQIISAAENNQPIPVIEPPNESEAERDRWFKALDPSDQQKFLAQVTAQKGGQ